MIIKMYPAQEGDAFLVSLDSGSGTKNIVIDMGLSETYYSEIRPDLVRMKSDGQKVDLLIITHIDQDHIQGAIEFIKDNGIDQSVIEVQEVWHNSFRHLQFDKKVTLSNSEKSILDTIIAQNKHAKVEGRGNISAKQGSSLASLLLEYGYNWNASCQSNAICLENRKTHKFDGFQIELLSPDRSKLRNLEKFWIKELNKKKYGFTLTEDKLFDDAFEFFMMKNTESNQERKVISNSIGLDVEKLSRVDALKNKIDTSPTNGSTLAFILESGDKKALFLGDSHDEIIIKSLKDLYQEEKIYFDAVKIPHHGSNNNYSSELADIINSNIYLISTNAAKHDHPNIEVISKLIVKDNNKTLYFNYKHDVSRKINNHELMEKHNFDISFKHLVEV